MACRRVRCQAAALKPVAAFCELGAAVALVESDIIREQREPSGIAGIAVGGASMAVAGAQSIAN